MPRTKKLRKIVAPPYFHGYRPYGHRMGRNAKPAVVLLFEEYEALNMADYQGMTHLEASKKMEISRATFARIYESARKKIAQALVESREIHTSFGNAKLDGVWKRCSECNARFTLPINLSDKSCPICNSSNIHQIIKE